MMQGRHGVPSSVRPQTGNEVMLIDASIRVPQRLGQIGSASGSRRDCRSRVMPADFEVADEQEILAPSRRLWD